MTLIPGWYEFHPMPQNTTHIAYVYEDGSIYLPEGATLLDHEENEFRIVDEDDFRQAVIKGNAHRLIRADRIQQALDDESPERSVVVELYHLRLRITRLLAEEWPHWKTPSTDTGWR